MQFITILLMNILTGAEVDLFVPSFPELRRVFNLTPFMVELTLGLNLTAHCITSLIVGNLGDKYGRKPIIILGLIIFTIGSIICVSAVEFWQLLFGRILQGIGISAPAVLSYLVIADLYSVKKQHKIMGVLNGVITLAMAFAPMVGSYVNLFFNWRGNFVVLLIMGLICLLMGLIFIPNSAVKQNIKISIREYLPVIRSKKAVYYILTICFVVLPYWVFIGISPILYMQDLGVTLKEFGFYQGSMAAVFSIVSLSSSYFTNKFGQKTVFITGSCFMGAFIPLSLMLVFLDVRDPLIITCVLLILAIGVVPPINILWVLCLEAVENAKGRIAALIIAMRLILTSIGLQTVSFFYDGTFYYLGLSMALFLILAFWFCFKLYKEDNFLKENV